MANEARSAAGPTFALVQTSCDTRELAQTIARALVEESLAACVQILPIESLYRWKGAVETSEELLLVAKIRKDSFARVEARIKALHSYELPEIVLVPIEGSVAYLQWIASATS